MFFFTELGMFVFLSVRLWGNVLRMVSDKFDDPAINKSLLVVKFLTPHKFGGYPDMHNPIHKLMSMGFVCVTPDLICNLLSILCTFAGLLIAYLWVARFFKMNRLNVNWWMWLGGCLGGHTMFYFISLL